MTEKLLEKKIDMIAEKLDVYHLKEVAQVIRRDFENDDGETTAVIHFYPPWNKQGTYGKMSIGVEYLDQPWQRERFEKFSGVKIDDMPVYPGDTPPRRNFHKKPEYEVDVRPFVLMLQPRKDDDGNNLKSLILRYIPSSRPSLPDAPQPERGPVVDEKTEQDFEKLVSATEQKMSEVVFKLYPFFKSAENVVKFRKTLFGNWDAGLQDAYISGLSVYAQGREAGGSHDGSKALAMVRYTEFLSELKPADAEEDLQYANGDVVASEHVEDYHKYVEKFGKAPSDQALLRGAIEYAVKREGW